MALKHTGIIAAVLMVFFLFGWFAGRHNGRNSVKTAKINPISGVVSAEEVAKGLTETAPDTIYVPEYIYIEKDDRITYAAETQSATPKIVPIENLDPGPERDAAINAALIDWNTKRSYKGTLFDDKNIGTLTYVFDVQFNRAGQIDYRFEPVPIKKQRTRLRPTVGGEYYTNGQYAFGGGVQYGAFGINVRALKQPKTVPEDGFAFGVGVQIIF